MYDGMTMQKIASEMPVLPSALLNSVDSSQRHKAGDTITITNTGTTTSTTPSSTSLALKSGKVNYLEAAAKSEGDFGHSMTTPKRKRLTEAENEDRKAAAFIGNAQPSRPDAMADSWKELGLHDILNAEEIVANGTVHLVHDLVKAQFRIKAKMLHPDKNDSITAAVSFGRVQQARDELLGLHDMASIRSSWRKSIGGEAEEKGEMFPSGLKLLQRELETAVRSRSATLQASTSSMPDKIPLRPAERNNAEMTGIVLRNKRIGANQFVFAGGGKQRKEKKKVDPADATTIDDKVGDNREIPAALLCPIG